MKQVRVKRVRFHNGIAIRQTVVSGVDVVKDKVEMFLTGVGVSIKQGEPFSDKLIPFGNIVEIDILSESKEL